MIKKCFSQSLNNDGRVAFDEKQCLTPKQKEQARKNIGLDNVPTQDDITDIQNALNLEISNRTEAEEILQSQIDELSQDTDANYLVQNYSDLLELSALENEIGKVLTDETKLNATTFYRYVNNSWNYIGTLGSYYTKEEIDERAVHGNNIMINNTSLVVQYLGSSPSLNNAPLNTILQLSVSSLSVSVANFPSDLSETECTLMTFAPRNVVSGVVQVLRSKYNDVYIRGCWGSQWSNWKKVAELNDVIGSKRFLKCIDKQVQDVTQATEVFGPNPSIDNAPMNTIISNGYDGIRGLPSDNYYGTIVTLTPRTSSPSAGYSDSLQIFLSGDENLYYRRNKYNVGWLGWHKLAQDSLVITGMTHLVRKNITLRKGRFYRFKTTPTSWEWTTVPDTANVFFMQLGTQKTLFQLKKNEMTSDGIEFYCDETSDQYNLIVRADSDVYVSVEVLDVTEEKLAELNADLKPSISTFQTIGVIGSSSASGEVYVNDSSSSTKGDHYEISWPQVLGRMSGATVTNYSEGGLTTRLFCILNSRPHGLQQLLQDPAKDLYILTLGANDRNNYSNLLGTSADMEKETVIDKSNWQSASFYECYAYIIRQIRAHAPKSRIVIMTNYYNRQPNLNEMDIAFNQAVLDLASYFAIPCIRPELDPFFLSNFAKQITSGHMRVTGYSGMAKAFVRMIENSMFDHRSYYDDVSTWDKVPQPGT